MFVSTAASQGHSSLLVVRNNRLNEAVGQAQGTEAREAFTANEGVPFTLASRYGLDSNYIKRQIVCARPVSRHALTSTLLERGCFPRYWGSLAMLPSQYRGGKQKAQSMPAGTFAVLPRRELMQRESPKSLTLCLKSGRSLRYKATPSEG